ncbi:PLP-dependent aminotransferase family protein [Actinophytocola oryzae]|uniref:GntR family transcriptional regulator n=1 Tax=Actinophytocola oryzae TaxID=502181 RepID=A0A4R7UPY3_9PSEU|nr:PLP-dependent aminotransferase family protein [Actinophytocola oryzae]TDV34522.1 GntR family transcriptional regulator [Actinophytocola oryzae]
MEFHVSLAGRGDLSTRIYRQLHEAVLDGRLRSGERLPPTRELARRLAVSRNTVALAYERLTAEGFLVGRVGAGTFVCATPPAPNTLPAAGEVMVPPRPVWQELATDDRVAKDTLPYDFSVGVPDARRFPIETWRRQVTRQLRDLPPADASYGDPAGHPALREEIARHIGLARSVRVPPAQVLVTNGAQQALDLIARVLVEPGTRVAVEEPGYPPARELFTSFGAVVAGVPVDDEGIDVRAIPAGTRLVYTTPSHQFPLGPPMSLARRTALLAWARHAEAVVIEDDYDSEFRFADRPLEPLHSLDRGDRVLYVGSFSKSMLPMLRLGFLVAQPSLLPALVTAKRLTDRQTDGTTQGAMAGFMADGSFARHVRRATRDYSTRRTTILSVLRRDFADRLEVVPSTAGLHLATWVRGAVDVPALVERAAAAGVRVEDMAGYFGFGAGRPGLVIGYGGIAPDQIEEGLRLLGEAW